MYISITVISLYKLIYFEAASAIFLVILYIFMKLQYNVQSRLNREFRKLTLLVLLADIMVGAVIQHYEECLNLIKKHMEMNDK